jgi:hypothetical protein
MNPNADTNKEKLPEKKKYATKRKKITKKSITPKEEYKHHPIAASNSDNTLISEPKLKKPKKKRQKSNRIARMLKKLDMKVKEHKGERLSPDIDYATLHSLMWFKCHKGHKFEAKPANVIRVISKWCRQCWLESNKYSLDEIKNMSKHYGGECLSSDYKNLKGKLRWKCDVGHEFEAIPDNFLRKKGNLCAKCEMEKRLAEMRDLAKIYGGQCLSTEYFTLRHKLLWRCPKGCTFERAPSSITWHKSFCNKC